MSRIPYQYAPLRYIHDVATGEFLNIGMVVFCERANYVDARISRRYRRLSEAFQSIDNVLYGRIARFIESAIRQIGVKMKEGTLLKPSSIQEVLLSVLPHDDSSFQFGPLGGGLTEDPCAALESLYERFVQRYASSEGRASRSDEDVWNAFRPSLEKAHLAERLQSIVISSAESGYEYPFEHAWKNGKWHAIEPVSFDLLDTSNILEKASRWVGRTTCLRDSQELGKIHLLLGAPRTEQGADAYTKVQKILERIPIPHEIIQEDDSDEFVSRLATEMAAD